MIHVVHDPLKLNFPFFFFKYSLHPVIYEKEVIQVIQVTQVVQVIQVIQVNEETTFQRTKLVFVAIFSTNLGYIWSIKVILVFFSSILVVLRPSVSTGGQLPLLGIVQLYCLFLSHLRF